MKTIKLTRSQYCIVDNDDFIILSKYKWCCSSGGYAVKKGTHNKTIYMHKFIMGMPNYQIDHINGNTLDNRKSNLRKATMFQNGKNRRKQTKRTSSIYKGVDFQKRSSTWRARIKYDYKSIHLGEFSTEIEAAKAYNKAALDYFKEFANLNKI